MTRPAPQPDPTSPGDVGRRILVVLPLPPRQLQPNARPHWTAKAGAVKRYRQIAWLSALAVRPRQAMLTARVTAKFYFADRRQRDPDNLLASLKAGFDGLVDGGVIGDDRDFIHMPIEQYVDRARPRVEIEVEEAMEAPR